MKQIQGIPCPAEENAARRLVGCPNSKPRFRYSHFQRWDTGLKKVGTVFQEIQAEFSDVTFLTDLPEKTVSIHKIACPSDQRDDRIDFPLIDRGKRYSLGEKSQLLEKLPADFRVGYLFADVSDRDLREQIVMRCREIYQNA